MTYPTCPRCGKGRMVPMLMSGPACDLACERAPIGRVAPSEGWLGASAAAEAQRSFRAFWQTLAPIPQLVPAAPIRQVDRYPVTCRLDPMFEFVQFNNGPYCGKPINAGDQLTLEYPDGSVEHFTVEQAGPMAVIAQNGTSDFDEGQCATLVVPA